MAGRVRAEFWAGISAAAVLVGLPAAAQTPVASGAAPEQAQSERSPGGEEIIVTANKRRERIQDVALAVSAVGTEELTRTQTLDLEGLAQRVPGLSLQSAGGLTRITLRGLNSGGDGATVATVIDDVPLSYSGANTGGATATNDIDTYDLQQVEVLRGPQGTLYGATAEGGLIKYVTKKPDLRGAYGGAELNGYGLSKGTAGYSAKAYANVPLSSTVAFRGTGFYEYTPGWIGNKLLGEKRVNWSEKYAGRFELLWQPSDRFSARATALLQNRGDHGRDYVDGYGTTNPSNQFGLPDGLDLSAYSDGRLNTQSRLYALHLDYDLGGVRIQSISSYGTIDYHYTLDVTAYAKIFGPDRITDFERRGLKKVSEEVRLASNPSSNVFGMKFDWQVGGFYTYEKAAFQQTFAGFYGLALAPPPFGELAHDDVPSRYREVAGYIDGDLHLTDSFDIEAGVRYSENHTRAKINERGLLFGAGLNNLTLAHGEDVVTYSVAPRFHFTPNIMAYARVASGYRPGGPEVPVGAPVAGEPTSFGSDSTTNYEAGLKGSFFHRVLTADIALFRIDWNDIQIVYLYTDPATHQNFTLTGNVGKARSQGVEWNLGLTPVRGLTFGLLGSYIDAKLTQNATTIGGRSGDALAYVPDISTTGTVTYEHEVAPRTNGFIGGDVVYTGKRYNDFPQHIQLPDYTTYNARAGVKFDQFSIEVYGQNLSDERGITSYANSGAYRNYGFISFNRPREVGVRLAVDLP